MRSARFLLFLFLCTAGAVFFLLYPLVIVQPFKQQLPDQLQRALLVFRIAPRIALALAVIGTAGTIFIWSHLRSAARIFAVLLVAITIAAACLTRVNVYEIMFHPAGQPRFLTIAEAKLDSTDMLTTVVLNGDAHAYPIREMGYHHVINDYVGGVPIVATY